MTESFANQSQIGDGSMAKYKTEQRKLLQNFLIGHPHEQFSAKELCLHHRRCHCLLLAGIGIRSGRSVPISGGLPRTRLDNHRRGRIQNLRGRTVSVLPSDRRDTCLKSIKPDKKIPSARMGLLILSYGNGSDPFFQYPSRILPFSATYSLSSSGVRGRESMTAER